MREALVVGIGIFATIITHLYEQERIHIRVCASLITAVILGLGIQYGMQFGLLKLWTDVAAITLLSIGVILLVYWIGNQSEEGDEQC